ncbi:MAG: universal stress protein [Ferruginibacter sp.]
MQKLFNKILVPVDFSTRSKRAVEKAMMLAEEYQCSVTLLHVVKPNTWRRQLNEKSFSIIHPDSRKETEFRLWKVAAEACHNTRLSPNNVQVVVQAGEWGDCMVNYISKHQVDLVMMGQDNTLPLLRAEKINADAIASSTHIPVISIPSGKMIARPKTIIIPVTDFLPVRKIMYGIYMATASNATLQLLQVKNEQPGDKSGHYLYKAYRLIQDNCSVHADIQAAIGENPAAAIREYLQQKNAGLVIVNPGTQTTMPGFFSRLLGRMMQMHAKAPVMTISPL